MKFTAFLVVVFGWGGAWGGGTFDIRDYGAKGDGVTLNTEFIQRAINDAEAAGGGRVVVAAKSGTYLTGSLWLASNIILDIGRGSTLLGSPNKADYPDTYTRSEGTMMVKHASLINAGRCLRLDDSRAGVGDWCAEWRKLTNITITGGGTIDGQGSHWWPSYRGPEGRLRPTLLGLAWVDGLTLSDLNVKNSPFWTVHLLFSRNIDVGHLIVSAPARDGHNTDGIDPDSCQNVYIHDCKIDVGDDCIAIKSGKNQNGRDVGIPTENVLIERCVFANGHGAITIGSEMSGDIRNVIARDCTSYQTDRVARLKTAMGRGGTVENITWEGIVAHSPNTVIDIDMIYPFGVSKRKDDLGQTPLFRNLTFRNITAMGALSRAGSLACLHQSPCENIRIEGVHVTLAGQAQCWTVSDIYGSATDVLPALKLPANPPIKLTTQSTASVKTTSSQSSLVVTPTSAESHSTTIQSEETTTTGAQSPSTLSATSNLLPIETTTGGFQQTSDENCNYQMVYIVVPAVTIVLGTVLCLGSRYFFMRRGRRGLKYRPVSGVEDNESWRMSADEHEFTTLAERR